MSSVHRNTCHQCRQSFTTCSDLTGHASTTGHETYRCNDCEASFSRIDVLKRHKNQHSPNRKKYSCEHCKKWRAPNGFARKDHLTQHLRNYHHIDTGNTLFQSYSERSLVEPHFYACCLHEGCPLFQPAGNPYCLFKSRGDFTKHMRKEHDETPFPCTKVGCKRVRGNGFFQKRGLMKHLMREHGVSEEVEDDEKEAEMDEVTGEDSSTSQ